MKIRHRLPPVAFVIAPVLALAVSGCDDTTPTAGTPQTLEVEVDPTMEARAGELIPSPVIVRVVDGAGAGVVGLEVHFTIEAGGGSLAEAGMPTSDGGEVRLTGWRMGEVPATNRLGITVLGLEPVTVEIEAGPGLPATGAFQGEAPLESPVAAVLAELPAFGILDRFGNPVHGETVTFVPSEGGSVSSSNVVTDADGIAATPEWTLAPGAGFQTLEARVAGLPASVLGVETLAGPPELVTFDTPQNQQVEIGLFVPHPPVVAVTDAHGNGVPGIDVDISLVAGGGSIDAVEDRTDETGRARVERWTLGSQVGENRVRAEAAGVGSAELVAQAVEEDADPVGRYFRVGALQVNQGNQTFDGDIPLVEGRAGLLRVWVVSSTEGAPVPAARIRIYRDDALLADTVVSSASEYAPVNVAPDLGTPSWNVPLPGEWIDDRLRVEVDVDPDHEVGVVTRRFGHFAAAGTENGWFSVVDPEPLRIRMIPIEDSQSGQRGQIGVDDIDDYMRLARAMLPIAKDEVTLGDPLVVTLLEQDGTLRNVLPEILAAWTASDYRDHYFQGVFPHQGSGGFASRAAFAQDPADPVPVAMIYDLANVREEFVAQTLTHNMGRAHAPCSPTLHYGPVDPDFPYESGGIGTTGFEPVHRQLRDPGEYRDLTGGCSPKWISDYTFQGVLEWRLAEVWDVSGAGLPPEPGLLVWGSIEGGEVTLEPAFPFEAAPRMPTREGPYRARAVDDAGVEIFSFSFSADPAPGTDGSDGGVFAWMVPVSSADQVRIRTIEIEAPGSVAVRSAGVSAETGSFALQMASSGNPARLDWDPGVFPAVWIRDAESGVVRGILRSGSVDLTRFGGPVEVMLSDGVQSWTPTPAGFEPMRY